MFITITGLIENLPTITRKQGYLVKLNRVNEMFEDDFVETLTLDDNNHICGVLNTMDNVLKVILMIKNEFYPLAVRFGLGVSSDVDTTSHYSLQALNTLEVLRHKKECALSDVYFKLDEEFETKEIALNTICKLLYVLEQNWTDKQRSVIHLMIFEEMNQVMIANEYGVSASNVQQMLKNGNYFAYKDTLESVYYLTKENTIE